MSSIFNNMITVSVANVTALVVTNRGCTTFSSRILVMAPFLTLMPAVFSPCACLFRNSVTIAIGCNPAFSARVYGITSKASANARTQ